MKSTLLYLESIKYPNSRKKYNDGIGNVKSIFQDSDVYQFLTMKNTINTWPWEGKGKEGEGRDGRKKEKETSECI